MRLLFEIDEEDYVKSDRRYERPSVRSIVIRDNKVAMIHSGKYNYYTLPGGGIEPHESMLDALCRETLEEAGLVVIRDSAVEFGYTHHVMPSVKEDMDIFIQDNYYYVCKAEDTLGEQVLDDYEADEHYTLEFVEASRAISVNRTADHGERECATIERESRVLEILINEGYLK